MSVKIFQSEKKLIGSVPDWVGKRQRFTSAIIRTFFRFAPLSYHFWYYHSYVWGGTKWMGVSTLKSVSDMWNYQEILAELRPSLVIEFGTRYGGSAVFFSSILKGIGGKRHVLTVDLTHDVLDPSARVPGVEFLESSSTDPVVATRIEALRKEYPGPVFAILDSDHRKKHVLGEMKLLRPLLVAGDYLVVEDSNVNGHPVFWTHGAGPYEAMEEYFHQYPNDYIRDVAREARFGFTFATNGFLIRQ